MRKTTFAGLTVLDENDSLYTDGASFLTVNPVLTDRLLEVGAITHRHDAHLALPNPTASASAGVSPTGGAIAPDLPIYIAFSLVDDEGGETVLAPATSVTTQAAYDAPSSEITASANYDSGTLVADTYYYAITLLDAGGGQTTLGPTVTVERAPGYANGRVLLSGLDNDFTVDGAVAWRLYRAIGGSDWSYIAQGSTDSFIDDGLDCADTSVSPPLADTQNSTNHTNLLRVVLPTAEPSLASAAAMRLYLSTDGDFQSPSFYQQFPTASAGQIISVPALSVTEGAPPDVSTCFPGASQIDPDTDILDWHWKRPVSAQADLPVGTRGDVRLVTDTGVLYGVLQASAATYADWETLAGGGGGGSGVTVAGSAGAGSLSDQLEIRFVGSGGVGVAIQSIDADTAQVLIGGTGTGGGTTALPAEVFAEAVAINVAIPDTNSAVQSPDLVVAGEGVIGEDYDIQVEIYITHTYDSDLDVQLIAPDATVIDLNTSVNTDLVGEVNFGTGWSASGNCTFAMDAELQVPRFTNGSAVIGHFLPEESFVLLEGMDIAGNWKLQARDTQAGDTGTIRSWGLRFTRIDDARGVRLTEDQTIDSIRAASGITMGKTFFRRGREVVSITKALSDAGWQYVSGNSTFPPPDTTAKKAYYKGATVAADNPLKFVNHDYADFLFPIGWTTFANFGTLRVGLEDEDGNYVYGELTRSSTSMLGLIWANPVDEPGDPLQINGSNIVASMVGKTAAWIRFVQWASYYYLEVWTVDPGSTTVTIDPLGRCSGRFTPSDKGSPGMHAFHALGKEKRPRFEILPAASSDLSIPGSTTIKGMAGDDAKRELVSVVGTPVLSASELSLDVLGTAQKAPQWGVPAYDSGFTQFVYYTRDRDGMVHVHFNFNVDNGTPRVNLIPPPPMFKPLRTDYSFFVPHSTGATGETVTVDQYGNIVRDAPSPGAIKLLKGALVYPAYDSNNTP